MLALAITTNDGAALGSFEKDGFDTTRSFSLEEKAKSLGLLASVVLNDGQISIKLNGQLIEKPKHLELALLFPTSQTKDVFVQLTLEDDTYVGHVPSLYSVKRIIQLKESGESQWLLQTKAYWPATSPLLLKPYLDAK